jgi:hypothetical protein
MASFTLVVRVINGIIIHLMFKKLNVCFFGDGSGDDYIMAIGEFYQLDNDWWD